MKIKNKYINYFIVLVFAISIFVIVFSIFYVKTNTFNKVYKIKSVSWDADKRIGIIETYNSTTIESVYNLVGIWEDGDMIKIKWVKGLIYDKIKKWDEVR